MVHPGPFISMPDLTFEVVMNDSDVLAELTSDEPQDVEYEIQPDAVLGGRHPIDCKDFYLQWISRTARLDSRTRRDRPRGSTLTATPSETLPDFNAAATTGYENIESVECSKTARPSPPPTRRCTPTGRVLFGGIMPAHVVETKSGVADITTIDPTTSSDDSVAAGDVWNNAFNGFDPEVDLSGVVVRRSTSGTRVRT